MLLPRTWVALGRAKLMLRARMPLSMPPGLLWLDVMMIGHCRHEWHRVVNARRRTDQACIESTVSKGSG